MKNQFAPDWSDPMQRFRRADVALSDNHSATVGFDGSVSIIADNQLVATITVLDLLLIVQEFQDCGGTIRATMSFGDWKGVLGITAIPDALCPVCKSAFFDEDNPCPNVFHETLLRDRSASEDAPND